VGKPLGKHSLGIPIKKWKINIKKAFFVGFWRFDWLQGFMCVCAQVSCT
jgi:hypothetical protein